MKAKMFVAVAIVAMFSLFLTSCGNNSNKKVVKQPEVRKVPSPEEHLRLKKNAYANQVKDSLLAKYGYDQNKHHNDGYEIKSEIDRLKKLTQASLMSEKIEQKNEDIRVKFSMKVSEEIAKYGISIGLEGTSSSAFEVIYDWVMNEYRGNSDEIQGLDKYGEARQKEIKDKVKKLLTKMEEDKQKSASAIMKTFSDYYPVLDLSKLPKEYAKYFEEDSRLMESGEGCYFVNYESASRKKFIQVFRNVRVYDSKLSVDFFGESDATYKLNKVSEGKWQVVKTKNGKTTKSHVFSDSADYNVQSGVAGEKEYMMKDDFSFSPGANMGVEIIVVENLYIKAPNKPDDRYPDADGKIAAKIASLQKSLKQVTAEHGEHKAIYTKADSISKKMLQDRYGKN